MTIYTTSSSAAGNRITANTSNSSHTILDGVALESTNSTVIQFSSSDGSLTVGGYAIGGGNSYAILVSPGASDTIVNILASGHLFGGGILVAAGQTSDIFFNNDGNVYGNDVGYVGSNGVDTITNSGFIGQSASTTTISTNSGDDRVYNSGTIQGDINLSNDNDTYTGTGFGVVLGEVRGGSGNDSLRGSEAADFFDGGNDSDLLNGRGGDDTLLGGAGADTIFGGDGNDSIDGGIAADTINGNAGDDTILGGDGVDLLRGGRDDDVIDGDAGQDNLRGDSGDDVIIGGDDRDNMFGGSGADVFLFEDSNDSGMGAARDRIYDFTSGEDKIDISELAGPLFNYVGSANFTAGGGPQVRAVELTNGTMIYIDIDGDGNRDNDIYLISTDSVTEGDFLL